MKIVYVVFGGIEKEVIYRDEASMLKAVAALYDAVYESNENVYGEYDHVMDKLDIYIGGSNVASLFFTKTMNEDQVKAYIDESDLNGYCEEEVLNSINTIQENLRAVESRYDSLNEYIDKVGEILGGTKW